MKKLFLLSLLLCCTMIVQGQISGKVIDAENNEPFWGVSVMIKGTQTGTETDFEGKFTLPANVGDVLSFSFIGYISKEVTIINKEPISVSLAADQNLLDDVVVVGYGVQKKSDVTGSVSSFNSKALEERPNSNVLQALQGSVAGLNISMTGSNAEGSNSSTVIRGGNSISASNKPLIILDGIPFTGAWSEINSNDVESIEILKDASSAAIYGARGANGVILIQTKKGKGEKVTIAYDGFISFDEAINIPKMMNGETFYTRKLEADGDFSLTENLMHEQGRSTDWLSLALRGGFKHQHNLSFRGQGKSTRYYVSGNYTDNKGISIGDEFKKISGRINLEQDLFSWLKFGTNTQYGFYDRSGNNANFSDAFLMNPLSDAYEANGKLRLQTWEDNSYGENPLSPLNERNNDVTRRFSSNNYLDVRLPVKGLTFKVNTGYTYTSTLYQNYKGRDTYDGAKANGILDISNSHTEDWIVENILSYTREFGKHSIFLTAMYSAQNERYIANITKAQDFPNDVMTYYQPDKASSSKSTASYKSESHLSQMFRANYSYDSRYLFTFTTRRDGFSAFGSDRKYGIFPSIALGWNIINENFMNDTKFKEVVNILKLRLSWGKNGNEAISAYSSLPNLLGKDYLTDEKAPAFGFYPSKLASPLLGWETTASTNVGLDFALLKDRIKGSVEVYFSNTSDLLLNRTIPSINGTSTILENIGKTKSNGVEFQISSVNIDHKDFSWSTDFNIVHNKTKLVDVGLYDKNGTPIDDIASGWFIGYPVNVNYDYLFDGIYQVGEVPADAPFNAQPGHIRYKNLGGGKEITPEDDKAIIGSRVPKFTAGMNNTFRYKNFSLSVFVNGSVGVTVPNYLLSVHTLSYRQNQLDKEFWSESNPINTYPANVLDGSVNPARMYFYRKADFLRIKDINLSYRFSGRILEKIKLQRLEVYANIKNLYTITSWEGLDPEFINSGTQQRSVPQTRQFLFGIRFDF